MHCSSPADQHGPALGRHPERARSFHPVNKQQPDNWQAAPLNVWWNKCILICAETWLWKADPQPNSTSELWGGIFFFLSFSCLSPDRLIFLLSVGWLLVVVSLHSTTLQSTLSWGSIQQFSRSLLSVSLTGLYCAKSWKLINSVYLTSQPFVSGVLLCALCAANIFRAPYQHRSSMYTKCLKAMTVIHWVRTLFMSVSVSSAHPCIYWRCSGHGSLNTLKTTCYVSRTESSLRFCLSLSLPHLSFQATNTNVASSASWLDPLSSLLQ